MDDAGFTEAVLDVLGEKIAVDAQRFYATGMSNGGMMAPHGRRVFPDRRSGVGGGTAQREHDPIFQTGVGDEFHSIDDPRAASTSEQGYGSQRTRCDEFPRSRSAFTDGWPITSARPPR